MKAIVVITGDIVGSRRKKAMQWQPTLKRILSKYGKEPKDWELFRGDSFQLTTSLESAIMAAYEIKTGMKWEQNLDVRMGIGMGENNQRTRKITESTGEAFERSGACFDSLKKQTLAISTGDAALDETLNIMFSLVTLNINTWKPVTSQVVLAMLERGDAQQQKVANDLGKSQSSISEALKRAGYEDLMKVEAYYRKQMLLKYGSVTR